jgi:hypothetical protein
LLSFQKSPTDDFSSSSATRASSTATSKIPPEVVYPGQKNLYFR